METLASDRAEKAWRLLKDLVRADTTNPPGREAAAAEILGRFLREEGVAFRTAERTPGRTNLAARLEGRDGAVLLAAHLDVVPAEAGRWSVPPFEGREEGGYLYGRGTIDMKHMAAMSAVVLAEASRRTLKRGLILAAVADEEAGCADGSKFLVEKHPDLVRAEFMLGEGGGFTQYAAGAKFCPIGAAEKGRLVARLTFRGRAGHASMPHPDNAAFLAAEGLKRLRPGRLPVHVTEPARLFFEGLSRARGGAAGLALRALASPALAPAVLAALPRDLASSMRALLSNTASPTRLAGSREINVLPEAVTVDLDVRTLPGWGPEPVVRELQEAVGSMAELEVLEFEPAVVSRTDTPLFERLERSVARHDPGTAAVPFLIPGYTDAKHFSRLGMDCYGFAPLLLDPSDAAELRFRMHGVDERVSKEAFVRGYALLEDAVLSFVL